MRNDRGAPRRARRPLGAVASGPSSALGVLAVAAVAVVVAVAVATTASSARASPTSAPTEGVAGAEAAGLLLASDLPPGYVLTNARTEHRRAAEYPVVDADCVVDTAQWGGSRPELAVGEYVNEVTRAEASEGLYTFPSTKLAKRFFMRHSRTFEALVECGTATASGGPVGTYSALDLGDVGEQRTGLALDPAEFGAFPGRFAVFRTGKVVGMVNLADNRATDDLFRKLVVTAERSAAEDRSDE